jgi:hypothetical protein
MGANLVGTYMSHDAFMLLTYPKKLHSKMYCKIFVGQLLVSLCNNFGEENNPELEKPSIFILCT